MMPPTDDLDVLFKRVHLANARRVWRDLVQRAERESWPYLDFLTLLAAGEIAHRQQPRLARHRRRRSMIFTTNKSLKAFGRVLHDEDLPRRSSTACSSAGA